MPDNEDKDYKNKHRRTEQILIRPKGVTPTESKSPPSPSSPSNADSLPKINVPEEKTEIKAKKLMARRSSIKSPSAVRRKTVVIHPDTLPDISEKTTKSPTAKSKRVSVLPPIAARGGAKSPYHSVSPKSPHHKDKAAKNNFFPNDAETMFSKKVFSGQHSTDIFAPEARHLREELFATLQRIHSEENFQFLSDLHDISTKKLSQKDLAEALRTIDKQYIEKDAPTQINIIGTKLDKILKSPKTLDEYAAAVTEVFALIKTNINGVSNSQKAKLAEMDTLTAPMKSILHLTDILTKVSVTNKSGYFRGLFNILDSAGKNYHECQHTCRIAGKQLLELADMTLTSKGQLDQKLAIILTPTEAKLAEQIAKLDASEFVNTKDKPKTKVMQGVLDSVHELLGRRMSVYVRPSTANPAESLEEGPDERGSVSITPPLTRR